jgi:hypothetical protein
MNKEIRMKYAKYRLTKQLGQYDCGPTAIVNVMKLNGQRIPYRSSHERLFKALKIRENRGVYLSQFKDFITKRRIPKSRFKFEANNISYRDIQRFLDKGYVAILAFGRGPSMPGHICVIAGYNKCGLEVVNWDKNNAVQIVGFDRFKKNVLSYNEAFYYFFERK